MPGSKSILESRPPALALLQRPRCPIPFGDPEDDRSFSWENIPLLPPLIQGRITPPPTLVKAVAGRSALHVRFDCQLISPQFLAPPSPQSPLAEVEHALIEVWPNNDPITSFRFRADFRGTIEVTRTRACAGEKSLEAVPDAWQESQTVQGQWTRYHGLEANGWRVEFVAPWKALGLKTRPPVLGFAYARIFATGLPWPKLDTAYGMSPRPTNMLEGGEAILGPHSGYPEKLELEPPCFGLNCGRLVLGPHWPEKPACVRVAITGQRMPADSLSPSEVVSSSEYVVEPGQMSVDFLYRLDRSLSSHLQVFNPPRLVLEVMGSGQTLYMAVLPMDRHLGICVDEPYGEPCPEAQIGNSGSRQSSAPAEHFRSPSAPAGESCPPSIREAWLDRIVRVLPRLRRRNTLEGAPSDFCLHTRDGSVAVNLMADDAWQALARIVENRFHTVEDRLVAAMALVGQKSVTNLILCPFFFNAQGQQTYHTAMHEWMGPLSILRYGGGPAVSRAAALARLLQHMTNPATDQPFVTRVVSLTRDGGPRQVTLKYEANTNLAPFVQHPGPVGAVAVDYRSSQTLLDPTGMAFFPAGHAQSAEGNSPPQDAAAAPLCPLLATLEEMLAGPAILAEGAGLLASIYAKLDPDELRRHRPNQLLSRGVFPEMCPNEEGPDAAFDPGHRQKIRVLAAARGGPAATCEGFTEADGRKGRRDGFVSFRWDDRGFTVQVSVTGPDPSTFDARGRQMERVHLAIDGRHEHQTFHHFLASLDGRRDLYLEESSGIQTLFKNLSTENHVQLAEMAPLNWRADFETRPDGYEFNLQAPWEAVGVENPGEIPPVIGMNVWIEGRAPHYEQVFLVEPRWRLPASPFSFADVYLGDPPAAVHELDLGIPAWGENTGHATLVSRSRRDFEITLQASTVGGMTPKSFECSPVRATVPAGGQIQVAFPFFVDPEEKMTSGSPQRLILNAHAGEKPFFRAVFRPTYGNTVSVYQRYGGQPGEYPNPQPGDKDFLNRKILYICARIPRFQRLTTRDGAASDFVLRAEDGCVEFNLMRPGVLDQMAEFITGRFDNNLDRMLGMFYLAYAPSVARHLSGGHRFMTGAGPLSILRGNFAGAGGNCGFHSRAFAGMVSHLCIGGRPVAAHTVGVTGHVITAVEWQGHKALMDADVGHFMLTPDGTGLATIEEFRANPGVLTTAGPGDLARYFTIDLAHVAAYPGIRDDQFPGVFPPGGPKA